ncbi:MAG: methyltransferase domain-containing protein [Myxococcales bacterium]|nr:methyltransferase domain-containing protein [Myxococcales bacterium]
MHRTDTPFRSTARPITAILLLMTLALSLTLVGCGGRRGHKRTPSVTRLKTVTEADRAKWQKPDLIVQKMGLLPGMVVADIGAGAGYMVPYLSKAVGAKGRVLAVETDLKLVALLKRRVSKLKLRNVTIVVGQAGDLPLTTLFDRMLLLNTYPELEQPVEMLQAMRERMKPTGRLVIIDFKPDAQIKGPPVEERLSLDTIIAETRGAGFVQTLQFDVLPRQYFSLFINHEETESGDDAVDNPDAPTPTTAAPPQT